jgi:hypothetical protein
VGRIRSGPMREAWRAFEREARDALAISADGLGHIHPDQGRDRPSADAHGAPNRMNSTKPPARSLQHAPARQAPVAPRRQRRWLGLVGQDGKVFCHGTIGSGTRTVASATTRVLEMPPCPTAPRGSLLAARPAWAGSGSSARRLMRFPCALHYIGERVIGGAATGQSAGVGSARRAQDRMNSRRSHAMLLTQQDIEAGRQQARLMAGWRGGLACAD